jgi:hypothetical protein
MMWRFTLDKKVLDEKVIGVISDTSKCVYETDGFVGDKIYKIGFFHAGKDKENELYYIAATEENMLITIGTVRSNLDEISAVNMSKDIIKRENNCLNEAGGEKAAFIEHDGDDILKQPVLIMLSVSEKLQKGSAMAKKLANEIIDWLDELTVMKTAKVSQKEAENYQQEYEKIMSAELIPHEDDSKDYSSTMSIFCVICAIISIFFYSMCVMPVITAVSSGFSAYRCYSNKNYKSMIACIVAFIIGVVFTYVGWNAFRGSIHIG